MPTLVAEELLKRTTSRCPFAISGKPRSLRRHGRTSASHEAHTFPLPIKPFMVSWTWDQDRIDRCCTHVIRPDGQLDSFCRYYSAQPAG